ncbi:TonB-dependent receptor domain-containing protein [Ralstonia mannitolilytica]|uniref:Outer membrane cobalamin translocator n=1 Tax=Ralstonia mannitolilytica TaxID=105219 RepID=A0AAJ4ZML0_9RALS|nr:TonB-dependent receptor [Ralstonia mannitolilytica]CAG2144895.1 Vitamin B12 transporter BtuB [Ralstonia mannitolilytica]CAJ0723548.1 Vitamin B12 transporter BtuB [Ralstonia mannitolilytica]SUD88513.1 Outer membrane cobalamin translocator [Ralstonia mannitolilytica]SUD94476.1 Outer membrane cobalamin translocator [Ralstonia mannitolilytica]SUD98173.1 Outer membrane cobalamin translocator [Ralstonia mannitolilytica]
MRALAGARLGVVAGVMAGAVAPAWSQSNAQANGTPVGELNPTVVTASRGEQPLSDALPHTTVISRADIERSQAPDAVTLLRREAGIEIAQNGGPGTNASLFMRGASSNQTLVLIDGVRVSSGTSGGAQIGQLMADQIDHIEVVRGNVSALYGSDAVGGVVQIFTRSGRGHAPLANAEIEYGARNTKRAQAGISGSVGERGDTSFAVSVSEFKTSGFSTMNPLLAPKANPNDNPYTNKSVSAQLSHRFSADWQAGLTYFQTWGDVSYDSSFGKPTDVNTAHNVVRSMSAYVDGKVTQDWKTRVTLSQGDDRSLNFTNGVPQVPARFNTRNQTASWQNDWTFLPNQLLKVGLEHLQTSIDSDAYDVPTRNVDSGYIGYEGKFGPHQLQLNLRRDRYSDFGGANSYYAGYGFAFTPQWKAVASVSNAFRAPSFNELYYPFFGNPNVQPEKARSVEGGVEYNGAIGLVRMTVFETDYSNLITSVCDAAFNCAAANVNRARVNGVETSYRGSIYGVDVRASFTMQNPQDLSANQLLSRRARHFGSVSAYKTVGPFSAGVEWNAAGDRQDSTRALGGYGVLNLVGRYQITRDWALSARLENVTNKNYQLIYPYNTASRGVFFTLSWQQHEPKR